MLLRKLLAALCPLLLCILLTLVFRWLDSLGWLSSFLGFAIKGLLLGAVLALILPIGGVKSRMNGLQLWLLTGAGLLLVLVLLQYLASVGALQLAWLQMLGLNGQMVLVESAAAGFMLMTVALNRR